MKLYIFSSSKYSEVHKLQLEEFEVEETEKTYKARNRRFLKSEIGAVSGHFKNEVALIENNPQKACEILLQQKEDELKRAESDVLKMKNEIYMLRGYLEQNDSFMEKEIYG